jgi:D-xylose 1-dehydrogenase (NADP+, D-xylono-1,5-lactone-forming)
MAQTRWAVLGTANIAANSFLPALRAVGGRAVVVGSRDPDRARGWADANQIKHVADYAGALERDDVDAVYIALPNTEHTAWAARAVASGRAVLCEKPLGVDAADTAALLAQVRPNALLWEAFVFPFHPQTDLIRDGMTRLGRVREIISEFHFTAGNPANIRWQADLAGGAMRDVGCYCIRLARLLYEAEPTGFAARASWRDGVDADCGAVLDFPGDRRLLLSAGMHGAASTFTRVLGEHGELRIVNPFHPRPGNTVHHLSGGRLVDEWTAGDRLAFQCGIAHVQAVLSGTEEPRHLARTDAPGNAVAIDGVLTAARAQT